jgi:hypothetical protein
MHGFVRDAAQLAGQAHRILDGLARLGLIPRELTQLAPFSIFFVLTHAAVRWNGIVRGWGRARRIMRGLSAAARKMPIPVSRYLPISQYL